MKEIEIKSVFRVYGMNELSVEDRQLVEAAMEATKGSYAPYSKFRVGAAARLANGVVFTGANQENAAYPSGLCAERTTLFAANAQYPDQPVLALAIAARKGNRFLQAPISPCGACRQVMAEYQTLAGRPMSIIMYGTKKTWKFDKVDDILPFIFDSFNEK